jgi:aminomethyltransferase
MKKTPLHAKHLESNAKMVAFGDWEMPINYGSQIKEHNAVREDAGMFDVSHMQVVDIFGTDSKKFLQNLITNDVAKLVENGKALYSCMLNKNAGVVDDLIVYFVSENNYRLVINAGTAEKDIAWMNQQKGDFAIEINPQTEVAIIAVQGPNAREKVFEAIGGTHEMCESLKIFSSTSVGSLFIGRTGYTGEDGFEIILPKAAAGFTWDMLLEVGVKPCGLGARDTLRLEAGMSLYGNEMDDEITPYQAGLNWTVDISDRDFIGKDKLLKLDNSDTTIKGLILEAKGVLRAGQVVKTELGEAIITSGTHSPTMGKSIALVRIDKNATNAEVDIRGKLLPATIVKLPFVRNGKILV